MMKYIAKINILLLFMVIIGSSLLITVSANSENGLMTSSSTEDSKNDQMALTLAITDAGYGDYDNDGFLDDVFVTFDVGSESPSVLKMDIYFDLVLPSEHTYSALFFVVTDYSSLGLIIYAYNTATESGDYLVKLDIYRIGGGLSPSSIQSSFIFDPPTKEGVGEPQSYDIVVDE